MRKTTLYTRWWKAAGASLLAGGFGLLLAAPTLADDACTAPAGIDCHKCDEIFSNAGTTLVDDLGRLSAECCAPACDSCAVTCDKPAGACDEAACDAGCCEETCGWCNLGDPWTLQGALFTDPCNEPGFTIGGWTQWGYHSKGHILNGGGRVSPSTIGMNTHPHAFNNHQSWLYLERVADGSDGLDWGFRGDLMYGVDADTTQAFGNRPGSFDFMNGWDHGIYGWAMPQLFVELAYEKWNVKAGHFYTQHGYESVMAPNNFFYSHAYTFFNNEPFTHTGVMVTHSTTDDLTVFGGWTAGWDTGFDAFNDGDNSNGSNFMGGFSTRLGEKLKYTYVITAGDFGTRGEGYAHTNLLDYAISDKWNYVLQNDVVETNSGGDHQFTIVNYLFYTVNDCLKFGGRLEWWKSNNVGSGGFGGATIPDFGVSGGTSVYEAAYGINYRPQANLVIRPEIRHEWQPGIENAGGPGVQNIFGVDAILTF